MARNGIVASIDVRSGHYNDRECCSHAEALLGTGRQVLPWTREVEDRGAGEILITSIDRDSAMLDYDLPLIEAVVNAVNSRGRIGWRGHILAQSLRQAHQQLRLQASLLY